jgi:hypothetical protein
VSPVKYEVGFYIPEDAILRSHCRENLKSYTGRPNVRNISNIIEGKKMIFFHGEGPQGFI